MSLLLRPAGVEDAAAIARVHVATWRHAYAGIVPAERLRAMDQQRYAARWAQTLSDPGLVTHQVVERGGDLVGFAVGGPYRPQQDADPTEDPGGVGELYAIYVRPEAQGVGVGTRLHDAVLGELGAAGRSEARLWVLEQNTGSRGWYTRRGWMADGAVSQWNAGGVRLPEVRLRRSSTP